MSETELIFDLQKSAIWQAVRWGRRTIFKIADPARKIFGSVFAGLLLMYILSLISQAGADFSSLFLGLSFISLSVFIFFWLAFVFFENNLKRPILSGTIEQAVASPQDYNLADFLSFEAARAIDKGFQLVRRQKPPAINSSVLFYFILADNPKLSFVFSRANLDFDSVRSFLENKVLPDKGQPFSFSFWRREEIEFSQDFSAALKEALLEADKNRHTRIELGDIMVALAKHNPIFSGILMEADLSVEDIQNLFWWVESLEGRTLAGKRFWDKKNLMKRGTLAKEWTAGYTITLDKYSTDWTDLTKKHGFEELIGHQAELEAIERILAKQASDNHVLLIGEPGSGKKSLIHGLTQRVLLGESVENLNYKRVVELNIASLLSSTESFEQAENTLDRVFQETVAAGNVILVVDEFHNYVGGAMRPGVIDISGLLNNYLHLTQFQIIGITTYAGLHKYIEQNPSILSLFEKVEVAETSVRDTTLILEDEAMKLEKKYKRFVTYPAIRKTIELASSYISDTVFPKKAVELLDETMVYVSRNTKSSFVLPEHVEAVVTQKTQIPIGRLKAKEKETLLNLEKLIHQRIINQDEAVKEVSAALRRARSEVSARKGPMGTFLFMGPTGVGKTETSKALAEIYFGAESRMIRLDMSEFQNVGDVARLLGGVEQEGLLITPVRENPFSLVLLDEIEKAHPNILNLFLQVLDEGFITDGLGRKVDFDNSIIIATSNAGYQIILEAIKSREEWSGIKQKLLDFLFANAIFRPEFINRFDAVVVFSPLSKENLLEIAQLHLQKLKKNLTEKNIEFIITDSLKEKVVELGYEPAFGARNMKRAIQDKVENALAKALLSDEIIKGDKIEIDPVSFSVKKL